MAPIKFPNFLATFLDLVPDFKLREKETGQQFRRQIARADIDPGVFVDLSAEEQAAVSPLLMEDLRPFDILRIVDQQCATLAAIEIFGFVKTLRGETAKCPEITPMIFTEQSVSVVFHHPQIVLPGDFLDRIHLASDS